MIHALTIIMLAIGASIIGCFAGAGIGYLLGTIIGKLEKWDINK